MITRHAIFLRILIAAGCASALGACSSPAGSTSGAVNSTATAMPDAGAPSGSYIGRGAVANLAPEADTLQRWSRGAFVIRSGAPGGAADLERVGTGEPQGGVDVYSPPITLSPGQSYVFSLWIDPSHISSGSAVLGIYAPSRAVSYGQVRIKPGPPGRYSVGATLPKGLSAVRIDFQPNGAAVERGQILKIAQPMLIKGVLPSASIVSTPEPAKAPKMRASPSP